MLRLQNTGKLCTLGKRHSRGGASPQEGAKEARIHDSASKTSIYQTYQHRMTTSPSERSRQRIIGFGNRRSQKFIQ
jgi:hypothetical protein